jgi:hypothetical protein
MSRVTHWLGQTARVLLTGVQGALFALFALVEQNELGVVVAEVAVGGAAAHQVQVVVVRLVRHQWPAAELQGPEERKV